MRLECRYHIFLQIYNFVIINNLCHHRQYPRPPTPLHPPPRRRGIQGQSTSNALPALQSHPNTAFRERGMWVDVGKPQAAGCKLRAAALQLASWGWETFGVLLRFLLM
jgi:hypothetical protein